MYCWNHEGVKIFNRMTTYHNDGDVWIQGYGIYRDFTIQFTAKPLSEGWFVEIDTASGRRGSVQGATFNLPLEVAAAVRRIL